MKIPMSSSQVSLNLTWKTEKQFQGGYKEVARGEPLRCSTREGKRSLTTLMPHVAHAPQDSLSSPCSAASLATTASGFCPLRRECPTQSQGGKQWGEKARPEKGSYVFHQLTFWCRGPFLFII